MTESQTNDWAVGDREHSTVNRPNISQSDSLEGGSVLWPKQLSDREKYDSCI